jgi:hypothetical protein
VKCRIERTAFLHENAGFAPAFFVPAMVEDVHGAIGAIDIFVTARDIDKIVAFLQANANSVPHLARLSFFVLMAKGFGKQLPDVTMVWNIKVDQSKKVTVNGNLLPRF